MIIDFKSPVGRSLGLLTLEGPYVGLELEYENSTVEHCSAPLWHTELDHSLRQGGIEYITVPLRPLDVPLAVREMVKSAKRIKGEPTVRCGLHVHVNCTHLKWGELYKFLTYYTLLEPVLFANYANGREISHFCVPTWTNTALTHNIYSDGMKLRGGIRIPGSGSSTRSWGKASAYLTGMGGHGGIGGRGSLSMLRTPKYAALNVSSLKKFGTLEFRQAPSSLDPFLIVRWVDLLLSIQRVALTYDTCGDILEQYERDGIATLCDKVHFYPLKKADDMDQEDAADTATIIAGHLPINWQQLSWEVEQCAE